MTSLAVRAACVFAAFLASPASAQAPSPPVTPLAASSAPAAASSAPTTLPGTVAVDPLLRDDNLLLFEVNLDLISVTDSLATYATPDGPLIPVGELSRLLEVDLTVSPAERRITGNIGEARRPVLLDLATGLARLNGEASKLAPGDVIVGLTDMYVRPALLEKILPVKVTIDEAGLRIVLKALEPLPIQSRMDRLGRLRDLQPDIESRADVLRVTAPYRALSPPAFDVQLATATDTRDPKFPKRYDVRAGADVLYTGFQGYVGSDDAGKPTTARALFERRDPKGRLFGPLGVSRASAGDVFTPTLAIGPRSVGGRGVSLTTAPLEQANVFERIDLRGELPIGYDVELYVNDVLRSGQQTPVRGRYEFRDVPLVRGINVIRVVSYGPRGERSEEVRVISVGGGQLAKGKLVVDFGAAQQEKNLVNVRSRDPLDIVGPGVGKLRLVGNAAYGLSEGLTITGGAANYSPNGIDEREMATLGIRTSLFGLATQVDAAHDSGGGSGLAIGLAGQPFGISTIARHAEYRGGFVDETIPRGGDGRALTRYTEVTTDLAVKRGKLSIPLSIRGERDQFANGDTDVTATVRASSSIKSILLSTGFDYERTDLKDGGVTDRMTGNFTASTFAAFKWQLRGTLDYDLLPTARLRAGAITADRNIGQNTALRLGVGHSFTADMDSTAQASVIFRFPFGDLSVDGDYTAPRNDWRIGLAFSFSLAYDPLSHRYAVKRIGAGSGGNLALQAFVDRNGNDLYDPGEQPVAGVAIDGSGTRFVTDENGRAFVTGLGYSAVARVQTNIDNVDLPYVTSPPSTLEFTPRAGRTAVAMYPLKAQGEVLARLTTRQPNGKLVGLSAVRVRIVREGGETIEASTEYDGSTVFEKLKGGKYRFELDEAQAARLKMHLTAPIMFTVPPNGGVIPDLKGEVVFDRASP